MAGPWDTPPTDAEQKTTGVWDTPPTDAEKTGAAKADVPQWSPEEQAQIKQINTALKAPQPGTTTKDALLAAIAQGPFGISPKLAGLIASPMAPTAYQDMQQHAADLAGAAQKSHPYLYTGVRGLQDAAALAPAAPGAAAVGSRALANPLARVLLKKALPYAAGGAGLAGSDLLARLLLNKLTK